MATAEHLCDVCQLQNISKPAASWCSECDEALCSACDDLHSHKQRKRSNLKHIDEKTTTYQKEIADRRKQINCHLDALELEMNKNLRDKQQEVKTTVEGFISIIDSKVKNVEKAIDNINQMKSHATDLQIFLALREIEKDVERELSYIKDLKTKPEFKTFDIQLQVSNGLKLLKKNVEVWGEISVNSFDSILCTDITTEKQAQIILPGKSREYVSDINSITLKENNSFKVESENIKLTGCEILPDGEILLVNQTDNTILMYNKSGSCFKEFKLPWTPYDITCIDKNIIAISSQKEKSVYV
ncbi:unnamed protein product [Mytilus edulis]|uniref:B box-type domain-containing protein n=1 Tax=Mytilus edulis TaxID=6550 RepID=A0A8S3VJR3_MYTED|nr:unnamed protein product [Mytilus edulis]